MEVKMEMMNTVVVINDKGDKLEYQTDKYKITDKEIIIMNDDQKPIIVDLTTIKGYSICTVGSPRQIVPYEHHGAMVWTRSDLKGKHREYCLCFKCKKLNTRNREDNCNIANTLFDLDVKYSLTTPVFECPLFMEKEDECVC